jgi:phenylalanyl-tRNA synthetase beta chain
MLISRKWLQTYFDTELPSDDEIARSLTMHAYEVEGFEEKDGDVVFAIDVLPNRSSDSLCHRGVAKELSILTTELPLKKDPLRDKSLDLKSTDSITVSIADSNACPRYMVARISGIKVEESPDWLKDAVTALGQRSINNVVDALNYVMFDIGQPLHAFDTKKLSGEQPTLIIRDAKEGEKITTLTDDEYELSEEHVVIVDGGSDSPIGLAGLKGGKSAEVTNDTADIIIESANFNPTSVYVASRDLKLHTDAGTRFKNSLPAELAQYGLREAIALVLQVAGGQLEGIVDKGSWKMQKKSVSVSLEKINALLGTSLSGEGVSEILKRLDFTFSAQDGVFSITPPFERTDIAIAEDIVEEIGRVYGYDNIASEEHKLSITPEVNKTFYYTQKIRDALVSAGFSEVMTYAFTYEGDVKMKNPLAEDKRYLRTSLVQGLTEALEANEHNRHLFGGEALQLFEVGHVFTDRDGEFLALGIATDDTKDALSALESVGLSVKGVSGSMVFQVNLDEWSETQETPERYDDFVSVPAPEKLFKMFSQYPFILRDIALWVPESVEANDIQSLIEKEAGELLVRSDLFDTFEKDGKISYAFHLVFQSYKKTLSDDEVNAVMAEVERELTRKGYEIR